MSFGVIVCPLGFSTDMGFGGELESLGVLRHFDYGLFWNATVCVVLGLRHNYDDVSFTWSFVLTGLCGASVGKKRDTCLTMLKKPPVWNHNLALCPRGFLLSLGVSVSPGVIVCPLGFCSIGHEVWDWVCVPWGYSVSPGVLFNWTWGLGLGLCPLGL